MKSEIKVRKLVFAILRQRYEALLHFDVNVDEMRSFSHLCGVSLNVRMSANIITKRRGSLSGKEMRAICAHRKGE